MLSINVIKRSESPAMFSEWEAAPAFAAGEHHPFFSRTGRRFYAATYDAAMDTSFAIVRGTRPLMIVWCNVHDGILGLFGQPMIFLPFAGLGEAERTSATDAAFSTIDDIASEHRATSVEIREEITGSSMSAIGRGCVARGGAVQVRQHGIFDLSLDEKMFHSSVRKSFQSLINWGRRNMRVAYINQSNADAGLFDAFREFHARIAGRVTRSPASWQAMFEWITSGGGELALAYLDGDTLVAGTMTVDGSREAYYASGVYDRERFEKPLAHFPLYDAILRSRARGMRVFDLGILHAKNSVSDKEYNIGYFKRGFATSIQMHLAWRWEPVARSG